MGIGLSEGRTGGFGDGSLLTAELVNPAPEMLDCKEGKEGAPDRLMQRSKDGEHGNGLHEMA